MELEKRVHSVRGVGSVSFSEARRRVWLVRSGLAWFANIWLCTHGTLTSAQQTNSLRFVLKLGVKRKAFQGGVRSSARDLAQGATYKNKNTATRDERDHTNELSYAK